jgi:alpha-L-fucosidase
MAVHLRGLTHEEAREKHRDIRKYAEYLHGQVRELLTNYGKIDILWLDFSYPQRDWDWSRGKGREDWQSEKLVAMIRELQPEILLNNRADVPGDFYTPEQVVPRSWVHIDGKPVVWEACHTFSGSWGYHRDEATWKSVDMLVRLLVDTVSKGGNLLLNVGPTARGEFDQRARDRLAGIGAWMKYHSRSIYGCTQAPAEFATPQDCRLTYNPTTRRIYVHVFAWPFRHLHLDGFAGKVAYAQLLNDASEIPFTEDAGGTLTLTLPVIKPDTPVPVIELFLS